MSELVSNLSVKNTQVHSFGNTGRGVEGSVHRDTIIVGPTFDICRLETLNGSRDLPLEVHDKQQATAGLYGTD